MFPASETAIFRFFVILDTLGLTSLQIQYQQLFQNLFITQIRLPSICRKDGFVGALVSEVEPRRAGFVSVRQGSLLPLV